MAEILKNLDVTGQYLGDAYKSLRKGRDVLYEKSDLILNWPVNLRSAVETWLLYSTIASLFMGTMIFHKVIDIFYGYPVVVFNAAILLVLNRLVIHRNHAIFVGVVMILSLVAARSSGTSAFSIMAQIVGILVFSVYYISMLTTRGVPVPRWVALYTNAALAVAVWGIIDFFARALHIFHQTNQTRLHSILPEPSFFVYLTLPAIGLYLNAHIRKGGYRLELATFFFAYILADSALGYIGLLLAFFFAFLPRLGFWKMCGFAVLAAGGLVGLFFASANFRIRVTDTFMGILLLNLQHVNASTYAVLSNVYVTVKTFIRHPLIGVGIGGYANAYGNFLSDPALQNNDPDAIGFNMYDASSLFLRATAELGLFGIIALLGFLIICARVRGDTYVSIRNSLLPFFIMRMGRYGAYFSLDLYFFVGIYVLNFMHYRTSVRQQKNLPESLHA